MKYLYQFFQKYEKIFIYFFISLFVIAGSTVSVLRYYQYESFYFDFGIFDRALWLVSHFQIPLVYHPNFHGTEKIIFADHFNPSLFLLAPLYWITERREVFLIFQAISVGLGILIGYRLSLLAVKNSIVRVGLVMCFMLFAGLQNALISDIHDATHAVLPLMIAFWAIFRKKWVVYFVMVLIILGFKESFAGLIVGLGIYLLWLKKYKQGCITIIFSLLWFFIVTNFVIPYFSGGEYFYLSSANTSFTNFFQPFIKIKTLFYSFLSFGFLPLFYPPLLPAIFENFFERFGSLAPTRWDLGLHYSALLAPLFFVSSLRVVAFLENKKFNKNTISILGVLLILISFILYRFILHGPLALFYNPAFYSVSSRNAYVDTFIAHIPTKGLIMTQNDIALRLTHHNVILLDINIDSQKPDVVALNLTPGQNPNVYFPVNFEKAEKIKNILLHDDNYKVIKYGNELYVFTRK